MAWEDFKFTPEDGLENTTTFESKPVSGARARQQFMTILNQIKAFLNGTVKNTIDEHEADNAAHVPYGSAAGTNAKTITLDPAPNAYAEGMALAFKNVTANTGAVTINVNGLGVKSILKSNGNALSSGNLKADSVYTIRYNGSNFILQGEGGEYGTATQADVRSTKTLGTENGVVPGTLDLTNLIAANIKKDIVIDGKTGTLVPLTTEKKWASGTANAQGASYITVTGLSFKPSMVIATYFNSEGAYAMSVIIATGVWGKPNTRLLSSKSGNKLTFDTDITLYANGFVLPVTEKYHDYYWIAVA